MVQNLTLDQTLVGKNLHLLQTPTNEKLDTSPTRSCIFWMPKKRPHHSSCSNRATCLLKLRIFYTEIIVKSYVKPTFFNTIKADSLWDINTFQITPTDSLLKLEVYFTYSNGRLSEIFYKNPLPTTKKSILYTGRNVGGISKIFRYHLGSF